MYLISPDERDLRLDALRRNMLSAPQKPEALLIGDHANLFWLTGRVFDGWAYIPLVGEPIFFVRRPVTLHGQDFVVPIRKPEEIRQSLSLNVPESLGLELDLTPWSMAERLAKVFEGSEIVNASPILRLTRSIKTPALIEAARKSAVSHARVYNMIPSLFKPGMTDVELQIEIERALRLEGCLGIFRISGSSMEFFMGNVLVGQNADNPSPYDFAMGGAGIDPSLPVGANGTVIRPGMAVMVDMNGNFTNYMTDMTRVYACGKLPRQALDAHALSIAIHRRLASMGRPGVEAKTLYFEAAKMVEEAGLDRFFMGHRQKAGFIGHGIGLEVNELPVIAPRSRDILAEGNVIALEPKFVIPEVGAVGIENTYLVTPHGLDLITTGCPEEIISLD